MRIVSLVPSVTDALAALGAGEDLVGVTEWCVSGAPDDAVRLSGTKNPEVERVVELAPDLVVVNSEENKPEHIEALRSAGLEVEVTHPRTVADAASLLRRLGVVTGRESAGERLATEIEAAIGRARAAAPRTRVMALVLIWRKPWMGVGPGTYVDGLLTACGFGNVLAGWDTEYPKLEEGLRFGADVVLLPSEPYEFGEKDLAAVVELVGEDVPTRFVDGQALTWHGPRTAAALDTFSALAVELAEGLPAAG